MKIVFLPGFTGGKRDEWLIKPFLKEHDFHFFSYNTSLKEPIPKIAYQLKDFINKIKLDKNEKIIIIGLSSGGVVADYYLKFIDCKKVKKFVSICSPFKGTFWIKLFPKSFKGLKQINDKKFQKMLAKKRVNLPQLNIYSRFDILVPGNSGKSLFPSHTWFFIHPLIQYYCPIIKRIKNFIK